MGREMTIKENTGRENLTEEGRIDVSIAISRDIQSRLRCYLGENAPGDPEKKL